MKKTTFLTTVILALFAALPGSVFAAGGRQTQTATGKDLYRVEVFSQLANYAGTQVGWFAKLVKDKFNLELNIIPSGEGVYATRMASGNLGDLVVWGGNGTEYTNAIEAGMLLDWTPLLDTYGPDIKKNFSKALERNRDTFGGGKAIYGFGHNVSSTATATEAYFYHPDIRFDIYQAIGSPSIANMMDYLNVLKRMVDYAPKGDSGLPAYAISLFADWDGDVVMAVKCMGAFYGYDEFGFTLYNAATNTVQPIFDDNSLYLQGLKFYNKAYQMGILDPDSATQTFSDVTNKYADGRVYWSMFSWLGPTNYNTEERLAAGKGMFAVAAQDQKNLVYGTNVYGGDRNWSIGAKAKQPERILELINWLSTPDGVMQSTYGPQGVTWDYDANNKPYLTQLGIATIGDGTVAMPVSAGGGTWADGQNKLNNTTFTVDEINPVSGERYNREFWSSELSRSPSAAKKIWQNAMGALSEDEYLEKNGCKAVAVASDFVKNAGRSVELEQTYRQVSTVIKDYSWRAIYAKTDAEFDAIVKEMITQAKALGYDECLAWDIQDGAKRAAAVARALGK